ncbi:biotin--[acetyl-CoA-carboxylase] ligase [Marisediminicola sp. LYQ134]|uniref:biotin--[acetyl-CoA-carboxylase] ligase n=1 Tax=Marisediminicola sp. LYQ134 TaxID=3391061 RepID=UPI00398376B0
MPFPRASALAPVIDLESTVSTNDEVLARAPGADEFLIVATTTQTGGRGRLGREWVAPPRQTLAASVLLRPRDSAGVAVPFDRWGWVPLMAGLAMSRAVDGVLPSPRATLKWPNDVLIAERKVCGILAEMLPTGDGVVVGAGVNLTLAPDALPTPTSTSLAIEGAVGDVDALADAVLATWIIEFSRLYLPFAAAGGDARASGVRSRIVASCDSIGRPVRVVLPDGSELRADAVDIDDTGRLVVELSNGSRQSVAAGDVTHLRYE